MLLDLLLDRLKVHYEPTPSRYARRQFFRRCIQTDSQSISQYVAALRAAAIHYEFVDLDDVLLEQFIYGLQDINLHHCILSRAELILKIAVDEAHKSTPDLRRFPPSALASLPHSSVHCQLGPEDPRSGVDLRAASLRDAGACLSCGGCHSRSSCRFRSALCRKCGKKGQQVLLLWTRGLPGCPFLAAADLPPPLPPPVKGATLSRNPRALFLTGWWTLPQLPQGIGRRLSPSTCHLRDYQGNPIPVVGCGTFLVQYGRFKAPLPLIIVRNPLASLLGLDWFGLSIGSVNFLCLASDLDSLLAEFADVFDNALGCYKGTPISLNLDPLVAPIHLKARRVLFALRERVDTELGKLISQGILEPMDHSPWETPIVLAIKSDGSLRICTDYKTTVNKALQAHPYLVPVVQHQLPVDEAIAVAQTIVTHRGAFKCRRLQFGISVAPGLFQGLMERLLHGIPGVMPYFDDVLIAAADKSGLVKTLRVVLTRFRASGLHLKRSKCQLGVPSVEFLDYLIDSRGIHPTPAKIDSIVSAPTPFNRAELQAFLGLLNFYSAFIPHKASIAEPLHRLLDASAPWVWTSCEAHALAAVKRLLTAAPILVQYNERLPLLLTCDVSPFGVGVILSHSLPDGSKAPIAFYSRTLSRTERNYSQLDKEALAVVAGVKHFHHYLYGRPFTLLTDHKPLLGILAVD
ncbi:PREDICTED: protein NYNRIN [Thamnophis sirtalis]|uniref:ribonuclease H n=1 Tax=Thamnophis sirtalis TaxID=35019 RepID=A0A6I9XXP4_9SAUR|nr:PREDICTED: protein NYNRIN [Thamnophis sirtalis]